MRRYARLQIEMTPDLPVWGIIYPVTSDQGEGCNMSHGEGNFCFSVETWFTTVFVMSLRG